MSSRMKKNSGNSVAGRNKSMIGVAIKATPIFFAWLALRRAQEKEDPFRSLAFGFSISNFENKSLKSGMIF